MFFITYILQIKSISISLDRFNGFSLSFLKLIESALKEESISF